MQAKTKRAIADTITFLFILLFVYAATSKLVDYQKFRVDIGKSPMLTAFAGTVAITVLVTELAVAGLLAFSKTRLLGLYASFTLMVMFSAYIVAITRFSEYIPCSCGGILQHMNWNQHLVFNLCFVALGVIGVLFYAEAGLVRIKVRGFDKYVTREERSNLLKA